MKSAGSGKRHSRAPQQISRELELERIIPLAEAAFLRGCSIDTLRRRFPHKIVKISPRRDGMRIRDAIAADQKENSNG